MKAVLMVAAGLTAMLASCASQYPALLQQSTVDAVQLKGYTNQRMPKAVLVIRGDSLYSAAQSLAAKGKTEDAYYIMDKAVLTYKLASSQQEAEESRAQSESLRKALSQAKDQLAAYEKVLQEVEAVK